MQVTIFKWKSSVCELIALTTISVFSFEKCMLSLLLFPAKQVYSCCAIDLDFQLIESWGESSFKKKCLLCRLLLLLYTKPTLSNNNC